jgi:hypothetical protein
MKLGRKKRPEGAKFLKLRDYAPVSLPAAPDGWDGMPGATIAMYANDRLGCCTIAAVANLASVQAAGEGLQLAFVEADVVAFYDAITGGVDNGAVEVDVLARVLSGGFPLDGKWKIRAWAGVEHADLDEVRSAAALFQGVYLGVELPDDWQAGADAGHWDVTLDPDMENGHAVVIVGYDESGVTLATWGKTVKATWAWFQKYVVEAYVLLDDTRCSVDVLCGDALLADAAALAGQTGEGA